MLTPIVPDGQSIPPGLSQAMLINGGNLLVLSGHVSVNSDGAVVGSDVESQLLQTFENMAATLKAAGADFHSVARLTYYIVNYQPGHLQAIRSVRDRFMRFVVGRHGRRRASRSIHTGRFGVPKCPLRIPVRDSIR